MVRGSVGPEGRRLSYLAAGARTGSPTLLVIHGAGVSARSWTPQLEGLAHALPVVAIDLPGHGESDPISEPTVEEYADAAHELLEALGTGPVFVVGHSLGGAVAQALAASHPDAVKGLVLVAACAKLPPSDSSPGRLLWFLPGPIRKVVFFWTVKKILFAPGARREAVLLGMEEIRTCRPETILRDVAAARTMDLEQAARGLRVPTLVLCGSRDKLTPPALSRHLHELIPGSRLDIIEEAGHMLPLEAPDQVNRKILEFVEPLVRRTAPRAEAPSIESERSRARRLLDRVRALLPWRR